MTGHREQDPLEHLRDANPVADDLLPSASLARIRARVSEDVMTTTTTTQRTRPLAALFAAGAVTAGALALAIFLGSGAIAGPGATPGGPADPVGGGVAMCVEQYGPQTLPNRDFAFDGTVTAIDGDRVTFAVGTAYRGVNGNTITLEAPGMTGTVITSAGGPTFAVGGRYLVAGDDAFAWACGFSQPFDAGVGAEWVAAFGG